MSRTCKIILDLVMHLKNPNVLKVKSYVRKFKCRQERYGKFNNSSVLEMYNVFKTSLEYEEYLHLLPRRLRLFVLRLRVSLIIQIGRYAQNNIPRNENYVLCCNQTDLLNGYHFI